MLLVVSFGIRSIEGFARFRSLELGECWIWASCVSRATLPRIFALRSVPKAERASGPLFGSQRDFSILTQYYLFCRIPRHNMGRYSSLLTPCSQIGVHKRCNSYHAIVQYEIYFFFSKFYFLHIYELIEVFG